MRTLPFQISFEDYLPIETILVLITDVTKNEDTLRYTYTSPKDVTIDSIGHYDSVEMISFKQDSKEAVFPLTLLQGDTVDTFIHEPYNLSSNDSMLLEIMRIENQSFSKNILLTEPIPEGYLKQIVKESNAHND
ncbi:hypothetical protein [Sporosarcina sp. A2]|uniref:hypothetical protein n=1 Tax=Sporosarcina sp. A2 TaxID=3393449 RepID=UPI003D78BD8F